MQAKYKVLGVAVRKVLKTDTTGHNCDFEEIPAIFEEYDLMLSYTNYKTSHYVLTLSYETGSCGSGWTTASWGYARMREGRVSLTHRATEDLYIDLEISHDGHISDFSNDFSNYSDNGSDDYYPSGGAGVNLEKFTPTGRGYDKPVLWVFSGDSNKGKSFIASNLSYVPVVETDAFDVLPEYILATVVVLGNKHGYTIEDVMSKVPFDVELIQVKFD